MGLDFLLNGVDGNWPRENQEEFHQNLSSALEEHLHQHIEYFQKLLRNSKDLNGINLKLTYYEEGFEFDEEREEEYQHYLSEHARLNFNDPDLIESVYLKFQEKLGQLITSNKKYGL